MSNIQLKKWQVHCYILVILIPGILLASEPEWTLESDEKGVKIFTAPVHRASGIVPLKFQVVLPFATSLISSVITKSHRKVEWVPDLLKLSTFGENNVRRQIEYSTYNSPWPFSDRTFLIELKTKIEAEHKRMTIVLASVLMDEVPIDDRFVRGNTYWGSVTIMNAGEKSTFLEMVFLTDFKGYIPAWIVNWVQRSWPKKLIVGLLQQLEKKDIKVREEFRVLD